VEEDLRFDLGLFALLLEVKDWGHGGLDGSLLIPVWADHTADADLSNRILTVGS